MKFLPVIFKNLMRNKKRTVLTFFSLTFSIFLFVFLFTVLSSMDKVIYSQNVLHNINAHSKSFNAKHHDFPESYIPKIKSIPHVRDIMPSLLIFSYFKKPAQILNVWGIIPEKIKEFFEITRIEGTTLAEFSKERRAALVGISHIEKYGWKIGDQVILKSRGKGTEIPFIIKGVVHSLSSARTITFINLPYLQNLLDVQGRADGAFINVDDSSSIPGVCQKIEAMFRNYPVEVLAFSQKSFMDSIVNKIKAILIAFRLIGWTTIISTFLLVANGIALSIRERTAEIGVMRVLGFSRGMILTLILCESTLLTLSGGILGAFTAFAIPSLHHITIPATVPLHIIPDGHLAVWGILIAILIGLFGGILPTLNSILVKPGDAIKSVG